ncbi:hypothetical protein AAW51_1231 [Caldimonas brevitalea]|uniref:Uncharacterized protein n=1 Tax=Caldimonas brevitalea TaxID=413882 RepID=A0A0G3BF45_9BURK|nr:hypothetical protein AAW51_1231 [Caldimonas brevitalea]
MSTDQWCCLGLTVLAFVTAFALGVTAPDRLYAPETLLFWTDAGNGWFQSDVVRVLGDMSEWDGDHKRARVHPIFSLVTIPVVAAIQALLSVDARTATALYGGATAAATVCLLFLTLRRLGRTTLESALLCLLLGVSAGWLFFYTIPESFQLGALTIAIVLFVGSAPVASARREGLRVSLASAASLSITVTNWMFGWLLAITRLRPLAALIATVAAFALVVGLALVQQRLMPTTALFTEGTNEQSYILKEDAGGPLLISKVFWFDSMLAPQPDRVGPNPYWKGLSMQRADLGSGSLVGWPALVLWIGVLALGFLGLRHARAPKGFRLLLLGGLAGQWALHLVYGEETFLYALHLAPLLVVLASFAFESRLRPLVLIALFAMVGLFAFNNVTVLVDSKAYAARLGSTRTALLEEMQRRPLGPWPRGDGHVLVGTPGSALGAKGYFEPGGSFSPWVGSFGISLWVTDNTGKTRHTSDSFPKEQTTQRVTLEQGRWPGVAFETPAYTGRWQQDVGGGAWRLRLDASASLPGEQRIELLLRGVGPAAGPVERLEWSPETHELQVNGRWRVRLPEQAQVQLGDEQRDAFAAPQRVNSISSATGWAYARVVLPRAAVVVSIEPLQAVNEAGPAVQVPQIEGTDAVFVDSLRAQLFHLGMAIDRGTLPPGDPLNYGQPWTRETAYAVAALARAGNLVLARDLAMDLARRDFFGGFGSEASAPGLALWALEEYASRAGDPAFDRAVWPHVSRKAQWLLDCLGAKGALLAEPQGPFLARFAITQETKLACLPGSDGLMAGRTDWHVPRMYLSAFAYRGLMDAAQFATRLGHSAQAAQWRGAAEGLRQAWNRRMAEQGAGGQPTRDDLVRWMRAGAEAQGFFGARNVAKLWAGTRKEGGDLANPRTYVTGTWPTGIAREARQAYAQRLHQQDVPGPVAGAPMPKKSYFDIAIAHQSLYLGQPDRTWTTLQRYWQHQVSPGAYTWWEGDGEENSSHGWEAVRGWVEPRHVTPHYGTAAEVLALQLDMLTLLDPGADEATLVIGAGVRREWLQRPIAVRGIQVRGATVDWRWDGQRVEVSSVGRRHPVRLAPVFPPGTPVVIQHAESTGAAAAPAEPAASAAPAAATP